MMRTRQIGLVCALGALTIGAIGLPPDAHATGSGVRPGGGSGGSPGATSKTFTTDADFDSGTLENVNHAAPNSNQLQLNRGQTHFPFVNVAASGRGTMVRIDVGSGEIVGEWWSAPEGRAKNPSRTTVDKLGNTWLANRDESEGGRGSVTRVGVVQGGTRVNADGTPNASGDFLKRPFAYNTCQDRNGDGLIATSRGLGDRRPWTNAGGVDNDGGVETAADECIITYTRVTGAQTRTVAVDANNDLWVGGLDHDHEKLSGATGLPVPGSQVNFGCGGYGGLIDKAGTLWSALGGALLRYEPGTDAWACLGSDHGDYGLGMDPVTGEIWHTAFYGNRVYKLAANGSVIGSYEHGEANAQGVAVDRDGNVWVAHSLSGSTTVGHLRTDGTFVGNVPLPGGQGPTGVAIDSNGKVWVTNITTNNAMRIDPSGGEVGGGGHRIGVVDVTVALGPDAAPYNYSDMTGSVLGTITAPQGSWTAVHDGGSAGAAWSRISWNTEPQGAVPAGTSLVVQARAADTEAALAGAAFAPVTNAAASTLKGRFVEVRATLTSSPSGASPVLSDLRIEGTTAVEPPKTTIRKVIGSGCYEAAKPGRPPKGRKHHKPVVKVPFTVKVERGKRDSLTGRIDVDLRAAADLYFHSVTVDALVGSKEHVTVTGEGEVNHVRGFRYLVSVVDGGRHGPDLFRLKVWKPASGKVVYDSQPGAADDAVPSTPVNGGSITIRR